MNWHVFPNDDDTNEESFNIDKYRKHEAWSTHLCKSLGEAAAMSFVVGSDIILDHVKFDLMELATMPKGTHIGQLSSSWIKDILPEQFVTRYDYEFMYQLKTTILQLRRLAEEDKEIVAHTVIEELAIYLFMQEAEAFMDCISAEMEAANISGLDNIDARAFDVFDDMDIVTYLFSNNYLTEDHIYHFDNWAKCQFYAEK